MEEFILKKFISDKKRPIILFGASLRGKLVNHALRRFDIEAEAFCDNAENKVGSLFDGKKVCRLQEVLESYSESVFVLCMGRMDDREAVRKQLADAGITEDVIEGDEILHYYSSHYMARKIAFPKKEDMLVLEHVLTIVTDCCTLKCKDCGHLVTYYKNPKLYSKDLICSSIEQLCKMADRIGLLSLLGGEPFLHPQLGEVCEAVAKNSNVEIIRLVTNGTLVPDDATLQHIKNSVTYVSISDYGELSCKKEELIAALRKYGIAYEVTGEETEWYPIDIPYAAGRTEEEVQKLYDTCVWGRGCSAIQAGEYHICNYSSTSRQLGFLKPEEGEFIPLLDKKTSLLEKRKQLEQLIHRQQPIKACGYCNFDFTKTIKAAVQKQ